MCPGLLFPCLLHPPWDIYIGFPDPSQGVIPEFPPSSTSDVICSPFLAVKEALLVAIVIEGEKHVKALLRKAEVTFTRSSDTVIGDIIRKCHYDLFLQTVVRAVDSTWLCFCFGPLAQPLRITTVSGKTDTLPSLQGILSSSQRYFSLLRFSFQEIYTHFAQFNSRRPYTRRGCLHESTSFLSRYIAQIDTSKHSSLQCDIIFDNGNRKSKSMTVKLV